MTTPANLPDTGSRPVLFIDRDGTLILEPKADLQVDSLEKLEFYPRVFQYLGRIVQELNYTLVMVTNQDGLGTAAFPEEAFQPAHDKMMRAFAAEGITFENVHIDRSHPHENLPTRKPGTGMLSEYFSPAYDLAHSYVIGDRLTDLMLARNLGTKGILIGEKTRLVEVEAQGLSEVCSLVTPSWQELYLFLRLPERTVHHTRNTRETQISLTLNLDGSGESHIHTGLGFFDHMLEQLARHSGIDITLSVKGDLHIDEHHTIEDVGLALGEAFRLALGNKLGISRYGFLLPMDDCLAQAAIDFGGRPWLVWEAEFKREKIGDMPTEMFFHFFKSFSDTALANLNIQASGSNEHHKIEAIFKAVACAIRMAIKRDPDAMHLPTTKGTL